MSVRATTRLAVAILAGLLAACGSGIDGTYLSEGDGFFESLTFKSGGKVEITFMGMTKEGDYELEGGKKVKITMGGDTQILTIDDKGCLDGGGLIGRYCKAGGSKGKESAGSEGSTVSGTYESSFGDESMRLEFLDGSRVRMTMVEGGGEDSQDGTYTPTSDGVTVQVPGGPPLPLKRQGDTLQGSFDGITITFTKK